jgi:hypothetical protein
MSLPWPLNFTITEVKSHLLNASSLVKPHEWMAIALYAIMVPILSSQMGSHGYMKGTFELRRLKVIYNIAMSCFSAWCAWTMIQTLRLLPTMTQDCDVWFSDATEQSTGFRTAAIRFHQSKFWEFADTVFLIMAGKPVIFLHYFHHIGAPVVMGGLVRSKSESVFIFILLNGIIHTIMYAYYGLSAAGGVYRRIVSPLRIVMTSMQIAQFLIGFYWVYPYKNIGDFAKSEERMACYYVVYWYVYIVLGLFVIFFLDNYVGKRRKKQI